MHVIYQVLQWVVEGSNQIPKLFMLHGPCIMTQLTHTFRKDTMPLRAEWLL